MQFIDEAKIYIKAGDGGDGSAAFRREAHVAQGGPSGGDGGNGGNVIFIADEQLSTLLDFKYRQHYRAKDGEPGRNKDQYGKAGDHLVVRVPVGTLIRDHVTGELLADLVAPGEPVIICRAGRGGFGNIHFKSPWNQAPRRADPGTPGDARTVRLELKLLADVGLLGYPNVGKSTLIAAVSRARPKVADYPFTTLVPHLGVVAVGEQRSFVLADIPGLIEGAAEGVGLGHRFLRHVERTRVLVHLLELSSAPDRDPERDYDVLMAELRHYDPVLAERLQIVVLNKIDLTQVKDAFADLEGRFARRGIALHAISAVTHEGVADLLEMVWRALHP